MRGIERGRIRERKNADEEAPDVWIDFQELARSNKMKHEFVLFR